MSSARIVINPERHMAHLFGDTGYAANIQAERLLNAAILDADIRGDFAVYLSIVDRYYADDVEASSEGCANVVTGKAALRSCVAACVAPLHVLAEAAGLIASIRSEPISSDSRDETHSVWTLELTGVTGHRCVLQWRACRRWRDGCVIAERHSEIEQIGEALTADDRDMRPLARGATDSFPKR
jgi:hypothetical protein